MLQLSGWAHKVGALAVLGGLCLPALARAARADAEQAGKQETPAEKIRKALEQPVTIEITAKNPIAQLVFYLREKARLPVVLDHVELNRALQSVNRESVENLDFPQRLEKVKLGDALRTVLRSFNLTYIIADSSLVITSPNMAVQRQMHQMVSVELSGMPLKDALRQLSRITAVNIVLDPRVANESSTPISLRVEEVTLLTAVRLVTELASLKAVTMGNVLFVTSESKAHKIRAEGQCGTPSTVADPGPPLPPQASRPLLPPVHLPRAEKRAPEP